MQKKVNKSIQMSANKSPHATMKVDLPTKEGVKKKMST